VPPETRARAVGVGVAVGVWLAFLSPAVGQEASAGAAPNGAPATARDTGPDTLRESYRDWVLDCAPGTGQDAPPARRCEIAQDVYTADTDRRVLRMALAREGDASLAGGARVALVTPFGVRVADGVGISAGSGEAAARARVDFLTCLQGGCVATGALDPVMLDALQVADAATITMNSTGGDTVRLDLSLAGFAAAWRRLGALE